MAPERVATRRYPSGGAVVAVARLYQCVYATGLGGLSHGALQDHSEPDPLSL